MPCLEDIDRLAVCFFIVRTHSGDSTEAWHTIRGDLRRSTSAHRGIGLNTSASGSAPQWVYNVGVHYTTADQWSFALGYEWDTISIGQISVPITVGGGQTIGGTVCPCNTSYSGVTFSVGKTF